jgi:hypothetical protein
MKDFKIIDFSINVILILFFAIYSLVRMDEIFIYAYFVVGAWQIISMVVHAITKTGTHKNGARYIYHWIAFVSVLLMFTVVFFYILLFTAAPMAIFYTCLCGYELYNNKIVINEEV